MQARNQGGFGGFVRTPLFANPPSKKITKPPPPPPPPTTIFPTVSLTSYSKYSRTPLIRPPSESHWGGRIRGMVAREGFIYEQKPLSVTRYVVVWEGWSLVRVVVRQGFYCRPLMPTVSTPIHHTEPPFEASSNRFPNPPSKLYPILQLGQIAWNFPKIANPSLLKNRRNFVTILHIMMFLLMSMKQLVADIILPIDFQEHVIWLLNVMMWFNKIEQDCHPSTSEMAVDKEAVGLSRVHMYESKCILPLRDNYLLCSYWYYWNVHNQLIIYFTKLQTSGKRNAFWHPTCSVLSLAWTFTSVVPNEQQLAWSHVL